MLGERSLAPERAIGKTTTVVSFGVLGTFLGVQFLAERGRWFLWLPVLLGSGIAGYFVAPLEPAPWHGPLVALSFVAVAILTRRHSALLLLAGAIATVALGFSMADLRARRVAAPVLEKRLNNVIVEGRIAEITGLSNGRRLVIETPKISRLAAEKTPKRIRLTLKKGNGADLLVGDSVRLRAGLLPPPGPAAPGAFDFGRMAWFQGLGAVGYSIGTARKLGSLEDRAEWDLASDIAGLRMRMAERIRSTAPGASGAVAAALMTGDRGAIPEPVLAAMRASGLAHLLAISGLHIGLIATLLFFGLRALLALSPGLALNYPIKKFAALAALVGAFAYLILTGATVPTQRAFLMVALVLLAVLTDRSALSMRTVAWAALAILLLRPESLLSVSFQMSFAAVIALIAGYEMIGPRLVGWRRDASWWRRGQLYVLGVAITTVIASTATMPFAAYHFNQISHFGLAANLLAVPTMALWIMPWAVVAFALMPFGLEVLALVPMSWGVGAVILIAETVAGWPGAVSRLTSAPPLALALVTLGGLWLCLWTRGWRWGGIAVVALGVGLGLSAQPPDLLIDDRGRLAALRSAKGTLFFSSRNPRGYTVESWLRRAGQFDAGKGDTFNCDRLGCIGKRSGVTVSYTRDARALGEDCRKADILLSAVPVRRRCPSAALVVDRFDLWREGGHAIWFTEDGFRVKTVAEMRGPRPWAPARRRARWRKSQ